MSNKNYVDVSKLANDTKVLQQVIQKAATLAVQQALFVDDNFTFAFDNTEAIATETLNGSAILFSSASSEVQLAEEVSIKSEEVADTLTRAFIMQARKVL